ncbi:alpha/beta fold hydrolase [Pararobbsia silviterrae]|uniref:Alpha/beta hydrolase n=1 Tax=Pararobbsia silviterrae TaxID=1792498 RepID=A0A494XUU5_9BURK|nr:alpha/beta fold hydrolase [Pararobbsia silviterrae]RKP53481.1 alpha/beta hydrolase [Pararobbsia silviterrae]
MTTQTSTQHANTGTEALLFKDDPQFWFEIERLFGAAEYGGALFGEVIAIARNIRSGDYDSWYVAMSDFADRLADEAATQLNKGHTISARDNYLRAASYYRSADFFLHANAGDPRVKRAFELSTACYRKAAALFAPAIEPVEIPFEGTTLTGYFHRVDDSGTPRKTLLLCNGFDGSPEEMHWNGGRAAVDRGYNVLVFDGPGQYSAVHRRGLHFRPNWESVVTPVVDYALTRKDVDPKRIALHCESLGGYLSPRAAAFEHRLAACIADDGVYDLGETMMATFPPETREAVRVAMRAPSAPELDAALARTMQENSVARWYFTHGMYAFGVESPRAFMAAAMDYHLRDGIAERIQCPTLVCDAEKDLFFQGQPQKLFDHLTCPKTMIKFTDAEGAGAHCQMGASRLAYARIYDWLDETLAALK